MSAEGGFLWVAGEPVAAAEARIDPRDRGFTLGDGLFETVRAAGGEPVRLAAHITRLRAGARTLGIPVPATDADLGAAIYRTLAANRLSGAAGAVVRLTLTRGVPERRGLPPDPDPAPTLVIAADPFTGYPPHFYERGMKAITSGTPRNERSPLANVKSLSYLENVLARREAERAGADEALLLNTSGDLCCARAANLFLVFEGVLATPSTHSGALPGTLRAEVLGAAPELGLSAEERRVAPEELRRADEAFLTSALLEVAPLVSVDGSPVGSGEPGRIARELSALL